MSGKTPCSHNDNADADTSEGLRLDKWLWQARFFKTRTLASTVVSKGKVRINRMLVTKPHYKVRPGDVLTFAQGREIRVVRVLALGERRGPATEARTLYEDVNEAADGKALAETRQGETPVRPTRDSASQKREPWGAKGGIDPRRARRQAIDAKMNGR
ncbi:MAG: RNA-binding S4 domain-containing protein [Geminicoccaceae bacterium]